jgi:hypothetical protein
VFSAGSVVDVVAAVEVEAGGEVVRCTRFVTTVVAGSSAGSLCGASKAPVSGGGGGSPTGSAPATSATKKPKRASAASAINQRRTCDIRGLVMASLPPVDSSRTVTSLFQEDSRE